MDKQTQLLQYLPKRLAQCVEYYQNAGYAVEEIRLHRRESLLLVCDGENIPTTTQCTDAEFEKTLLSLCEGSMYAHEATIQNGYISLKDGSRVGVCGDAVTQDGELKRMRSIHGLNLRIGRWVQDSSLPLYQKLLQGGFSQSVLIYSAPGVGKTTVLRDLSKKLASGAHPLRVCVVDSRRELTNAQLTQGTSIDLLSGYPKAKGMEIALRTLSPQYLICDEIGSEEEAQAILQSMHAGVKLIASIHAHALGDLLRRPIAARLHALRVFDLYCGITRSGGKRNFQFTERDTL